jgi:hypothetical protein
LTQINWDQVNAMTSDQIENLRVEIIKDIRTMEDNLFLVKEAYEAKSKEILRLELEKQDLRSSLSKARHSISQLKHDEEVLRSKYWNVRRGV